MPQPHVCLSYGPLPVLTPAEVSHWIPLATLIGRHWPVKQLPPAHAPAGTPQAAHGSTTGPGDGLGLASGVGSAPGLGEGRGFGDEGGLGEEGGFGDELGFGDEVGPGLGDELGLGEEGGLGDEGLVPGGGVLLTHCRKTAAQSGTCHSATLLLLV